MKKNPRQSDVQPVPRRTSITEAPHVNPLMPSGNKKVAHT